MSVRSYVALLLMAVPTVPAGPAQPADRPLFRFQNNFWVNLHHLVRADARRRSTNAPPLLSTADMSAGERAAWSRALDSYSDLASVSLIFDEHLIAVTNALATVEDPAVLPAGTVEPKIAAALNAAAPVYRVHLWDLQRTENERWIAQFRPLIEQHAAALTKSLAAAYHVSWPTEPILVDLSCDAGPNLAYTTGGRPGTDGHTVIVPRLAADRDTGFEIVFHEASHTVDAQIIQALNDEAARQHAKIPEDLWHEVIFYTAGELVKREMGKQGDPAYQTYGHRVHIYEKFPAADRVVPALERDWQAYLDGKTGFEDAVRGLVRDTGTVGRP